MVVSASLVVHQFGDSMALKSNRDPFDYDTYRYNVEYVPTERVPMTEHRAAYTVAEPNDSGIPRMWLKLMYRLAKLQGGRTYMIAFTVPDTMDAEPTWAIMGEGKTENDRG